MADNQNYETNRKGTNCSSCMKMYDTRSHAIAKTYRRLLSILTNYQIGYENIYNIFSKEITQNQLDKSSQEYIDLIKKLEKYRKPDYAKH